MKERVTKEEIKSWRIYEVGQKSFLGESSEHYTDGLLLSRAYHLITSLSVGNQIQHSMHLLPLQCCDTKGDIIVTPDVIYRLETWSDADRQRLADLVNGAEDMRVQLRARRAGITTAVPIIQNS